MGTTYEKAGKDVLGMIEQQMKKHHAALYGMHVKIGCLMASNAEGDPVKVNGYPGYAKVKVVGHKDRAHGVADAEIIIDAGQWDALSPEQQASIIDHELTHLELKRDKAGNPQTDDQGRPKLKMRLHDWQLGGFAEVVQRHGKESIDALNAQKFAKAYGQLLMWADDAMSVG